MNPPLHSFISLFIICSSSASKTMPCLLKLQPVTTLGCTNSGSHACSPNVLTHNSNVKLSVTQGTTMDIFVTKHLPKATILRFPSNGESVAAFQSRRVNAVSLFHPPLITMRKKIGRGQIVLPAPVRQSASSAGVRREADKTWRDWFNTAIAYYYATGQTQVWYGDFLKSFDVDPKSVPAIRREDW